MTKIVFGTDGWRAKNISEINEKSIRRVAQAFAIYILKNGKKKQVAIGYDGRKNSKIYALEFAAVLWGNGLNVLLSNKMVPTPVVSFAAKNSGCDAGVMITASHNPPDFNGVKFKSSDGSPFSTHQTNAVEDLLDKQEPIRAEEEILETDLFMPYMNHVLSLIDFDVIRKMNYSVALDSMGGAGAMILEDILKNQSIIAETIDAEPSETFHGRSPEPVEKNLKPLSDLLKQGGFSVGFATDGDADRLGVMDDKGRWMNVQETILYLAEYYTKERKVPGGVVKTASVTDKIRKLSEKGEITVFDVQVGFKYVAEAMIQNNAAFGAEESGGFGFKEHLPERDGIFSALIFLEMMAKSGFKNLSSFISQKRKEWGKISYSRIDATNNNPERFRILPDLSKSAPHTIAGFAIEEINWFFNKHDMINGLKYRLTGQPRWLLLRISETEPIVRVYTEAENNKEVEILLQEGLKFFSNPRKIKRSMIQNNAKAAMHFSSHQGEVAEVKNPSYVYPPAEYYPLAPSLKTVDGLKGVLMDMDGTTTTTEVLCVYALEMMIRRMSGKLSKEQWTGLDHSTDLEHIIGNSTTRHVEYLVNKYRDMVDEKNTIVQFLDAASWTLRFSPDENRRNEVITNIRKLNLTGFMEDLQSGESKSVAEKVKVSDIYLSAFETQVNLGIDMYYQTYHQILIMLRDGRDKEVKNEVFGDSYSEEILISPMPGIPFLIPLLKGWLGEEAVKLSALLFSDYEKKTGQTLTEDQKQKWVEKISKMGVHFEKHPTKVALVTSSIFYEANIIIKQILKVMSGIIAASNLSEERKRNIVTAYEDYHNVYDAFVTATDSSEIRLKPHRDLYSIAMHRAGLLRADFKKVIGFEDSESGTVAIRAAGIGCCVAVPFAETQSHNLEAAAHILQGGVPSAILDHDLFNESGF